MRKDQKEGFTFVELLIAVLILSGAIGGVLLLYTTSMISSREAWNTTLAVTHGEHVLEEMQARDSLQSIASVDWGYWIAGQRLTMLPEEKIVVNLIDPNSDPLDIEVKIDWVSNSRAQNVTLKTKMTK